MAKIKSPLFSLAAHGELGKALTYSEREEGSRVRFQKKQKDYEGAQREPIREAFRLGIDLWGFLPHNEKALWSQIEKKGYVNV